MTLGRPREGKEVACAGCGKVMYLSPKLFGRKFCGYACRDATKIAKRVKDGNARCARCREWKPIEDFVKGTAGRPHSYCKPCNAEWHVARKGIRKVPYREAYTLSPEQKKANKREHNRMQHVKRRGAGPAPHKFDIGKMLCEQDARCVYCGVVLSIYHIDHKTPVSKGGSNDIDNLHLTCPKCNMRKGAMTHEEFLVSKKRPVYSTRGSPA